MTRGSHGLVEAAQSVLLAAISFLGALAPATAQQDRERAQLMQLQQQLQRLQSDNASLQSSERQANEKLKQQTDAAQGAQRDVKRLRAQSATQAKEADDLRAELTQANQSLTSAQAQIEQLRKDVALRDKSLEDAAEKQRQTESAAALVSQRLKLQTARGDQCEAKDSQALQFGGQLIDRIAHDRLRLCEPFTGIWKVKAETDIQGLRQRLEELRLDGVQAVKEQ